MDKKTTLFKYNSISSSNQKDLNDGLHAEAIPSDSTIANILNFSKSLKIVPTKPEGASSALKSIEIVLS